MAQIKWRKEAIDSYQKAGEDLKLRGYRAMREILDPDCNTVFTMWAGPPPILIIQQTWCDTGDVVFYAQHEFDTEVR